MGVRPLNRNSSTSRMAFRATALSMSSEMEVVRASHMMPATLATGTTVGYIYIYYYYYYYIYIYLSGSSGSIAYTNAGFEIINSVTGSLVLGRELVLQICASENYGNFKKSGAL